MTERLAGAQEMKEFRAEVRAWLSEHRPAEPDFLLPESFMEVGTDQQFHFLRDWQQQVYEAGYLGMSWPSEYGGGGVEQAFQDIVNDEMARQHVTVALSGVGGDEIFGGYRRYLGFTLDRWFRGPLGAIARGAVSAGVALLPKSRDSAVGNLARLASRYIAAGGGDAGDGGIGRYTQLVELGTEERLRVLYPAYNTPDPAALQALRKREWRDSLESMTAFDMRGSLPEQLLNLTDRMSMAVSLEVRVPYLDHRVLAAARRTPSQHKIRGRNMRVVQKDALRPLIGDEIITRKKRGFGFPLGRWIRDESSGFIEEHIGRDALADRGLFDPDAVARLRGEHERKEADHTDVLTGLLFFELWARSALDS